MISHLASDEPEQRERLTEFMRSATGGRWGRVRSTAEVERFFGDRLEVRGSPGLVEVSRWLPDSDRAPQ